MRRLATVAILCVLAGATWADDKGKDDKDKANPTGTWKWTTMGQNGQTRESTMKLKLEGDKLTGAILGRNNQETAIEDATFKDGEISFKVTRERNGQKMTIKYTGKLSGDTIKGKTEVEGQTQSRDWEAKRAAEKAEKTDK